MAQVSSILTDEEVKSLETIHWASKSEPHLRPIIEACPTFQHVKHVKLWDETEHHFKRWDQVPWSILQTHTSRYHAILTRRKFRGCPFLDHTLVEVKASLPDRFAFIVPNTPFNASGAYREARDMKPQEWSSLIAWCEARDLDGVIVNSPGGMVPPKHKRLVDLTGQTTLIEAVEILKKASAYIGIDTWASVLADQLFDSDMLQIRSQNPYLTANPWCFYLKHQTFPFLVPTIGAQPYPIRVKPEPNPNNRFLMMLTERIINNVTYPKGTVVEVGPILAAQDIGRGYAVEVWKDERIEPRPIVNATRIEVTRTWATPHFNHQPGTILEVSGEQARTLVECGSAVLVA